MSQKSIARSKKARLAAAGAAMALSLSIAAPGIASAQEPTTPESSAVEQPATEGGTESGAPAAGEGAGVDGSATASVDGQLQAPAPAVTPEDAAAAASSGVTAGAGAWSCPSTEAVADPSTPAPSPAAGAPDSVPPSVAGCSTAELSGVVGSCALAIPGAAMERDSAMAAPAAARRAFLDLAIDFCDMEIVALRSVAASCCAHPSSHAERVLLVSHTNNRDGGTVNQPSGPANRKELYSGLVMEVLRMRLMWREGPQMRRDGRDP
ncbi:hypothetical protein CH275_23700 [Rhodococcus sp. 06-235-1A]|uniref:hypothetical protein n=1 Tax=Rhodococcus sp. 06-235-1A TaxID=2022508 RepID=UPI000B9C295F|nr:hypothetical protein [Rhodococcus sp. 06-235-1A]OZC97185.1 hypothetical protein CH275_23700 [Rhodococcus sp. 06-235-1A]